MKTLAAVGLLLFSGVLVVSGALMGTVAAQQDAEDPAAPRALGPVEIRVFFEGPEGRAWPRERVADPSVLVEANAEPRRLEPGPAAPRPAGEKLSRQLDLEWVEPREDAARKDGDRKPEDAPGRVRRNEAGYGARVVFVESRGDDDPAGPGGYWRALYTPPADRRIVGLSATPIFKHEGITRTIPGFAYPHLDDARETGRMDASRRHLEALERSLRDEAWDEARRHAEALDRSLGDEARTDLRELRSAVDGREKARALEQVSDLREALGRRPEDFRRTVK